MLINYKLLNSFMLLQLPTQLLNADHMEFANLFNNAQVSKVLNLRECAG